MEEEKKIPKPKIKINWLKVFQSADSVAAKWTMVSTLFLTGLGIGAFSNNLIKNAEINKMSDDRSDLNTAKNIQEMKCETEINRLNNEILDLKRSKNNQKDSQQDGKK